MKLATDDADITRILHLPAGLLLVTSVHWQKSLVPSRLNMKQMPMTMLLASHTGLAAVAEDSVPD